jgi:hypothetical protein
MQDQQEDRLPLIESLYVETLEELHTLNVKHNQALLKIQELEETLAISKDKDELITALNAMTTSMDQKELERIDSLEKSLACTESINQDLLMKVALTRKLKCKVYSLQREINTKNVENALLMEELQTTSRNLKQAQEQVVSWQDSYTLVSKLRKETLEVLFQRQEETLVLIKRVHDLEFQLLAVKEEKNPSQALPGHIHSMYTAIIQNRIKDVSSLQDTITKILQITCSDPKYPSGEMVVLRAEAEMKNREINDLKSCLMQILHTRSDMHTMELMEYMIMRKDEEIALLQHEVKTLTASSVTF